MTEVMLDERMLRSVERAAPFDEFLHIGVDADHDDELVAYADQLVLIELQTQALMF